MINIKLGIVVVVGAPGRLEGDAVEVGNTEGFDYLIIPLFI